MAGNQILIPMLISFGLSVLLGPVVIPFLKRLKVGQMVREDGPYTHLKKSGTPTMGGILILVSVAVTTVLYVGRYPKILPVFFLTLGFGLIGFFDDYLKIVKRNSVGLCPWQKMLGQILVTGMFAWYLSYTGNIPQAMRIPFIEGRYLRLGALEIPFLFLVVTGTANGTNFTDGLDGLVSSVTVMVATFFTVVSMGMGAGIEPLEEQVYQETYAALAGLPRNL